MGFFEKLKNGLKKTKEVFSENISKIFGFGCRIDDEFFEGLEEALIASDVGVKASDEICKELRKVAREKKIENSSELKDEFLSIVSDMLCVGEPQEAKPEAEAEAKECPSEVVLVVGVNGVGKTTTVGKLAYNLKSEGKKVVIAAADTFRDAAVEQLQEWATKAEAIFVENKETMDPGAVIYDAIRVAKEQGGEILICDTAGRLHSRKNLMAQLEKIRRVVDRFCPNSKIKVLLVLDATTGQNAVTQAHEFKNAVDLDGIALTKLDGTAKGGVVISISSELSVPIEYVGLGEGITDLERFSAPVFVQALFDFEAKQQSEASERDEEGF